MAGRIDEARRAREAVLQGDPALRISNIATAPFRRHKDVEKLSEAWRIAGVPE